MEQTTEVPVPRERPDAGDVKTSVPASRACRRNPQYTRNPRWGKVLQASSAEEPRLQDHGLRGRPDAGDDDISLPPPDGVAGALAWLTSRPARSEEPPVQFTSHGCRLRCARGA